MDNNIATSLAGIMANANNLAKAFRTGEGLNLTEDQKKEYKKQMKEQGGFEKIAELEKKMKEVKNTIKNMNNARNKNK